MSRRFSRLSLVLVLLLSSKGWAVGLGDIQLDSALNEPLRAEISLLGATPAELTSLTVALASADTFTRYGIDRPAYLQQIRFAIIPNSATGSRCQADITGEDDRTVFDFPGGGKLAGWTIVARIHGAAGSTDLRAADRTADTGRDGPECQPTSRYRPHRAAGSDRLIDRLNGYTSTTAARVTAPATAGSAC